MSSPEERDPLATRISNDVIEQALKSVEKVQQKKAEEPPPVEPDEAEITVQTAVPPIDPAAVREVEDLKKQLLDSRQALRQREAELEASQALGRETVEKLKDQHERTLRAVADLENYKKRVAKERQDTAQFGQEKVLREMLPILDNLERALEHAQSAQDVASLKTGVEATRRLFESTLAKLGAKGFSALGQPFDPRLHEAVQSVESDAAPGTVVQEMLKGYMLHDRLMRPSMVVVSRPKAGEETTAKTVMDLPAVDGGPAEASTDKNADTTGARADEGAPADGGGSDSR